MMNLYTKRSTYLSNRNGIIDAWMFVTLEKLQANSRLYFYKHNIYDVVEIACKEDTIQITTFANTTPNAENTLIEETEFYLSYFESAGLINKIFLFDTNLKVPVRYEDFEEKENLESVFKNKHVMFTLDRKHGYITEANSVVVFVTVDNCVNVDKCILALTNDLINIIEPKLNINYKSAPMIMLMSTISGMLSGVKKKDIEEEIQGLDLVQKFLYPVRKADISDENILSKVDGLKTDLFDQIYTSYKPFVDFESKVKDFNERSIALTELIEIGLDCLIKAIKNPNESVRVVIDAEQQTIHSMFIFKGAGFITPGNMKSLAYFRELFDSDNVEFVMN